ncbi:hypothetical protein AAL_06765 [Moelleriella libera RCEF 2490]|uniref:Uncharacterized protein n=1 Tax=Moelleriella libera RCEF 2490 TaxID=1081109 RepID=A0A167Y9E9_9HYPO|nr:hypothetical protein AAL_06765 [Moelleriella libera RCEF 2490]
MPYGNVAKRHWIVPQESLRPEDLPLGSILKRPDDPVDLLGRHAVETIDATYLVTEREQRHKSITDGSSGGFGTKLAVSSILTALFGISPELAAGWSQTTKQSIEATRVRSQRFNAPDEYVNRLLLNKEIADFLGASFFTPPLYMVVGLTVASTLSRKSFQSGDTNLGVGIGVGPPGTDVALSAGVSGNRGRESSYEDYVEGDVVLAYRLRRFRYSKRRARFDRKSEDETGHAQYALPEYRGRIGRRRGRVDSVSEDETGHAQYALPERVRLQGNFSNHGSGKQWEVAGELWDFVPVFSYFEDEDIDARELGVDGFEEPSVGGSERA